MKRWIAFLLSAVLMFCLLSPCAFAADTASTPGTATLAFERTGGAFAVCRSVLRVQCKPHHTRVDGELRAVGETGFLQ